MKLAALELWDLGPGTWGSSMLSSPLKFLLLSEPEIPSEFWGNLPLCFALFALSSSAPTAPKGLFSLLPQHNPNIESELLKQKSGRVAVHRQLAFSLGPKTA